MATEEVAKKLVELCKKGAFEEAIKTLLWQGCCERGTSAMGDMPAEAKGFDAVSAKTKWWVDNHDVHSAKATGTVCRPRYFCRAFRYRCDR